MRYKLCTKLETKHDTKHDIAEVIVEPRRYVLNNRMAGAD